MARAHEEEPGRPGTLKELRTNRKHLEKHSKKNYFQKIIKHNYFYEFLEQVEEEKNFFFVFFFAFVAINAKMRFQTFRKKAGKSV